MGLLTQDGLAPASVPRAVAVLTNGALLLLAFGLYFAFGHAVRHMLHLGTWHSPRDEVAAARWLARAAVPAGIAGAVGLAALAVAERDTTVTMLTPSFRIVAALTLPHMIVTTWLGGGDGPGGTLEHE